MPQFELEIREARESDAQNLIDFLNQVGKETTYLTMDEAGILLSVSEMQEVIRKMADAPNQLYLLALLDDEVAGVLSISADFHERIFHIGELFLVVAKRFSRNGLGTLLLEEALTWAKENGVIKRLELTVQVRNKRAVHLYQKMGFFIEAEQERGAYVEEEGFLPVYRMAQLID